MTIRWILKQPLQGGLWLWLKIDEIVEKIEKIEKMEPPPAFPNVWPEVQQWKSQSERELYIYNLTEVEKFGYQSCEDCHSCCNSCLLLAITCNSKSLPGHPHHQHQHNNCNCGQTYNFQLKMRWFWTCWAHELSKLGSEHVEDANASSHQQDEVQDGWIAQQLVRKVTLNWWQFSGRGYTWSMVNLLNILKKLSHCQQWFLSQLLCRQTGEEHCKGRLS